MWWKGEDVPEVTLAENFPLKSLSEVFYDTEGTKDKTLEADPNLEKTMTICQDKEAAHSVSQVIQWEESGKHCSKYSWHIFSGNKTL